MPDNPPNSEDPARHSEDRMREAVALTERVELQGLDAVLTIFAGFRPDDRLSLYFGDDPYYQFDSEGRLRRALVGGRLFRTQGSGLAALTRTKEAQATVLVRHDLDSDELERFRMDMLDRLRTFRDSLAAGRLRAVRQVPRDAPIVERILDRLEITLSAAGELAPAINKVR